MNDGLGKKAEAKIQEWLDKPEIGVDVESPEANDYTINIIGGLRVMTKVVKCDYSSNRFEYTDKLMDMINAEVISAESVLQELLQYLPQDTIEDFAKDYVTSD